MTPVLSTVTSSGTCMPRLISIPAPTLEKVIAIGPGHAAIPAKLVAKCTCGHFVDLADVLSVNRSAEEHEL